MTTSAILSLLLLGLPSDPTPTTPPARVIDRAAAIVDTVLRHHVDPPPRQQMILDGLRAVYTRSGLPLPSGLGRRVSDLPGPGRDPLAALLAETWPGSAPSGANPEALGDAFLTGLLTGLGDASLESVAEARANDQMAGNLYVGVHIAVNYDEEAKRTEIGKVLEGGPADRAGARDGDQIEAIDGVSTDGVPLREVVERLRGLEGTEVTVQLRSKTGGEPRTLRMTRGRMPRPTVAGLRRRADGAWSYRLDGPEAVGYVRINEIAGSTPQELRQVASAVAGESVRALILDLRGVSRPALHPAVLLADSLLDRGVIGRMRTAGGVEVFEAEPDALFRDLPLVVLTDSSTQGAAAWLCAGLQDNHRARLLGSPTGSAADIETAVPLPGGEGLIRLTTGRLERADGRPLAPPEAPGEAGLPRTPRERWATRSKGGVTPDVPVGKAEQPASLYQLIPRSKGDVTPDVALAEAQARLARLNRLVAQSTGGVTPDVAIAEAEAKLTAEVNRLVARSSPPRPDDPQLDPVVTQARELLSNDIRATRP